MKITSGKTYFRGEYFNSENREFSLLKTHNDPFKDFRIHQSTNPLFQPSYSLLQKNHVHIKSSKLESFKVIINHIFTDSLAPIISLSIIAGIAFAFRRPFENYTRLFDYSKAVKKAPKAIITDIKEADRYLSSLPSEISKKCFAFREAILNKDVTLTRMNGIMLLIGPPGTGKTYSSERIFRWVPEFERQSGILRLKLDDENTSKIFEMLLEMQNGEYSGKIIKMLDKKQGAPVKTILMEVDEVETLISQGISIDKIKKIFGQNPFKDKKDREIATYLISTGNEVPKVWKDDAAINSRLTKVEYDNPTQDQIINVFIPDIKRLFPGLKDSSELADTQKILSENLDNYVYNYRSFKMTDFTALLKRNYEDNKSLQKALITTMQEKLPVSEKYYKKTLRESINKFIQEYGSIKASIEKSPSEFPLATIIQQLNNISVKKVNNKLSCQDMYESLSGESISLDKIGNMILQNSDEITPDPEFLSHLDKKITDSLGKNISLFDEKEPEQIMEISVKAALEEIKIPKTDTNSQNTQKLYNELVDRLKEPVVGRMTYYDFSKGIKSCFKKLLETVQDKQDTDILNKFTVNNIVTDFNKVSSGAQL